MLDALGIGVIGLGEIGQFHLRGYARAGGARLLAVADLNTDLTTAASVAYGTRVFGDYRELLADPDVQLVSVCLPHALHARVAIEAIEAGKHVLVEKPLAVSVAECDQILAAAQSASVVVGMQHNQIFFPAHVRAKELIDSGAIGAPVQLRLRLAIGGKYQGWRTDPAVAGGGILFDAGVHRFYLARYLFGEIAEASAVTDKPRAEGEDRAVVSLRFDNGALGVIDASYHGPAKMFDDSVEIVGTEGALYISGIEAEFEGYRTGPALRLYDGGWRDLRVPGDDWAGSVAASIQAFVDAVRTGAEPPVSLREGRRVVELIEMAYAG